MYLQITMHWMRLKKSNESWLYCNSNCNCNSPTIPLSSFSKFVPEMCIILSLISCLFLLIMLWSNRYCSWHSTLAVIWTSFKNGRPPLILQLLYETVTPYFRRHQETIWKWFLRLAFHMPFSCHIHFLFSFIILFGLIL